MFMDLLDGTLNSFFLNSSIRFEFNFIQIVIYTIVILKQILKLLLLKIGYWKYCWQVLCSNEIHSKLWVIILEWQFTSPSRCVRLLLLLLFLSCVYSSLMCIMFVQQIQSQFHSHTYQYKPAINHSSTAMLVW